MNKLYVIMAMLVLMAGMAEGKNLNLTFNCAPGNDLYTVLAKSGAKCPRFDTASEAVERAAPGSAVLILADGYPDTTTKVDSAMLDKAAERKLRLYVEYPAAIAGLQVGAPRSTVWERAVVSSGEFGDALPKLRILAIQDCHYVPVQAAAPMIVVARVAGYDKAIFGIPETAQPILFDLPERNLLIATTKLSNFVTGRYAPTQDWKTVWEHILRRLDPDATVNLQWTPDVHAAYGPSEKLPSDYEKRTFDSAAKWFHDSRLLVHPSREPELYKMLRENAECTTTPGPDAPMGDGSHGLLEGYASAVRHDGSQVQRIPLRADCNAEAAMTLALDWMVNQHTQSRDVSKNLLDYVYFNSGMCKGARGNPEESRIRSDCLGRHRPRMGDRELRG